MSAKPESLRKTGDTHPAHDSSQKRENHFHRRISPQKPQPPSPGIPFPRAEKKAFFSAHFYLLSVNSVLIYRDNESQHNREETA